MKTAKKTERNGEVSKAEALEFYRQLRTHNLPYFEAPKLLKRIWIMFKKTPSDGRERPGGGSLGVSGPSRKERVQNA